MNDICFSCATLNKKSTSFGGGLSVSVNFKEQTPALTTGACYISLSKNSHGTIF
jgi:hypothetical protein